MNTTIEIKTKRITPSPFTIKIKNEETKMGVLENSTYQVHVTRIRAKDGNYYYSITINGKSNNVLNISYNRKRDDYSIDVSRYRVKKNEDIKMLITWIQYSMDCIELIKFAVKDLIDEFESK